METARSKNGQEPIPAVHVLCRPPRVQLDYREVRVLGTSTTNVYIGAPQPAECVPVILTEFTSIQPVDLSAGIFSVNRGEFKSRILKMNL